MTTHIPGLQPVDSPAFQHQAPLLSPVEGPVLCHPTHYRAKGCQGPPGHPQTSPWGIQGLTAGIRATQWEEKLRLYRCLGAGAPQARKVLPVLSGVCQVCWAMVATAKVLGQQPAHPSGGWWVLPRGTGSGAFGTVPYRSGWGPQPPYF